MKRKHNGGACGKHEVPAYALALVGTMAGAGTADAAETADSGASCAFLTGILARHEFTESFPWVKLAGVVSAPACELAAWAGAQNLPVYADCQELFAAHPDLDMACDLSDDDSGLLTLRRYAPASCSLIDSRTVRHFCEAIAEGSVLIGGGAHLRADRNMFDSLMDQVNQDILVLDSDGRILDCNQHFLETWGGPKADFIGRDCEGITLGQVSDGANFCPYREVLDTGEKVFNKLTVLTDDGRMRYFHINAFPVLRSDLRRSRIVLMRSDVTAKVQMEQRLQQSEKMAAIGELSTYIAHEIRNPLFAIGGFANSLLRASSLDEQARDKVRIILEESRRLDEILKSIIHFARPTDQAVAEVDINAVARQTVELMGIGGEERHITLTLNLDPSIPRARGNAEMIKQCLINCIKNSQEALPESGGTITVSSCLCDAQVQLAVSDTGAGIPAELHAKVFNPFYSTKDKGAGLGLAMTRKIIEETGGRVLLSSQVGKGTTITMTFLPVLAVGAV